jgi:hypothetical protein
MNFQNQQPRKNYYFLYLKSVKVKENLLLRLKTE